MKNRKGSRWWQAKTKLLLCGLAYCFTLSSLAAATASSADDRPNIVVILVDDMGFSDLGCYGAEYIQTPNIDKLATEGLRYRRFYNAGRCWPTRTSLMTGDYYQQTPYINNREDLGANAPLPFLPQYLSPLGYFSYHSGKWHIFGTQPVTSAGFKRSFWVKDHDRYFQPEPGGLLLDDKPIEHPEKKYVTRAITDHAIEFLTEHEDSHSDNPFFLYLAYNAPHFPLQAEPDDIALFADAFKDGWDSLRQKRYENLQQLGLFDGELSPPMPDLFASWSMRPDRLKREIGPGEGFGAVPWDSLEPAVQNYQAAKMAIHAAMIYRIDAEIGRLITTLKSLGVYENTIIVFLSDNGATLEQIIRGDRHDKNAPLGSQSTFLALGPGWSTAANTPFRFHKSWVYEGGIRTPFIFSWPAQVKDPSTIREGPGDIIDLLPTFLDAAGTTPTKLKSDIPDLPGVSLIPSVVSGEPIERDFIYLDHNRNVGLIQGDWKVVKTPYYGNGEWELYNLTEDPSEMYNLADTYPEQVMELTNRWKEIHRQYARECKNLRAKID